MPDEIRRRSEADAQRELSVDKSRERPGGAEGGDESPSADVAAGAPADDQAPHGDTDQHSDAGKLPPARQRER